MEHKRKTKGWLRKFNNGLLTLIIAINLYVLSVPFLPQLLFAIQQHGGRQQQLEQSLLTPVATPGTTRSAQAPTTQSNHIVIPSMLLDQPVIEGKNMYQALDQGVWRWPGGSTPDKGSNTIMLGHRFTYTKPKGVFYFLDKVHTGDRLGVIWNNITYVYRVKSTTIVPPTQTNVLSATEKPTLTLYTCTPLWLPKNRLVITAELEADPAARPIL